MRVLLDENIPHRFRRLLGDHQVFTVSYMGWVQKKNGELLAAMKSERLEVLVTHDRALASQQNLQAAGIAVVIIELHPMRYAQLRDLAPQVLRALEFLQPGQIVTVGPKT